MMDCTYCATASDGLCAGKADVCYPSCYKFVHSWESGEMEEKDGDRRRSRTSIHAGVTLFN